MSTKYVLGVLAVQIAARYDIDRYHAARAAEIALDNGVSPSNMRHPCLITLEVVSDAIRETA